MLEGFRNPPVEFSPMPFWFWNGRLDESEIERQIREMQGAGIGGFFIHGRFGLRIEYMSEEWMRCIEHGCEVAGELGMHVYLYDENPFPSGVAGGEAMKCDKHFNKFLDILRQRAHPGETVCLSVPSGQTLSAIAVNLDRKGEIIDLTNEISDGELIWTAADSAYEVLVFAAAVARYAGFIYGSEPDYFEPSLVDIFFGCTHERYAARLGPYLGNVIKGIFTDEPKIQCIYHMHDDPNTTAWFADLPEQFAADHGYDLVPRLAHLVADVGPETGKVRRDFWQTVSDQYVKRFFARYRAWCEDHGIRLTGHLFLEEGLYANTMYQGSFPRVLAQFHIPGVDHLGLATESEYSIGNIPRSVTRTHGQKLASSVAHAHGLSRVLSETFGCCGWTLNMEQMKWIVDWQFTLGINLLCPHAFYYSLAGVRKTDAPPSQFYQATYWPYYQLFADYVARLSFALSQGKHRAQIALLYPEKGFQSEWAPGAEGSIDTLIADYFDIYCAYLAKEHLDYDVLSEDSIRGACAVDQQLRLAGEGYELLILPPTTAVAYETALKIKEYVEDGGMLIGTMLLPVEDADGDNHEQVRQVFRDIFQIDPVRLREDFAAGIRPDGPRLARPAHNVLFFQSPEATDLIPTLRDNVSKAIRPEVSARWHGSECHDITCVHRITEEGDIFFFSNNSEEPREVQVSIRCTGAPHLLDPETGEAVALPNCTQRGAKTVLLHRFERYGSLLVFFGREPALAVARPGPCAQSAEIPLAGDWQFALDGLNCISLREWTLDISTQHDRMLYDYRTAFEAARKPARLLLVLDDLPEVWTDAGCAGSDCKVFVNGKEATDRCGWTLDIGFQSIDIAHLVKEGANEVRIVVEHGGWSGDPQLMLADAKLMGDFSLEAGKCRLVAPRSVVANGSWTDQGYPYYSGTASYRQTVRIPELLHGQRVILEAIDPADMVEFVVNANHAGTRPWAPFSVDITALVSPGPNAIELKVTNSLANCLLSEPRPSGLLGGARVIIY